MIFIEEGFCRFILFETKLGDSPYSGRRYSRTLLIKWDYDCKIDFNIKMFIYRELIEVLESWTTDYNHNFLYVKLIINKVGLLIVSLSHFIQETGK